MPVWVVIAAALSAGAAALLVTPSPHARLPQFAGTADANPWLALVRRIRTVPFGPSERRRQRQRRVATIEALAALAAELVAGASMSAALRRCGAEHWPVTSAVIDRHGSPLDAARALGRDAERTPMLRPLAAAWPLAANAGMSMAPIVEGIAQWARAQEDVRDELQAQLAGPRATGRMLAALPVFAMLIGFALGADPIVWLLSTPLGLLCLVAGLAFTGCGLAWLGALSRRVERQL